MIVAWIMKVSTVYLEYPKDKGIAGMVQVFRSQDAMNSRKSNSPDLTVLEGSDTLNLPQMQV